MENHFNAYVKDLYCIRNPWFDFLSYLASLENNALNFLVEKTLKIK